MKGAAQVLMLTAVLFALTSAPPATVDHMQGLGGVVAEMVLNGPLATAEVAAQHEEWYCPGAGTKECECFCVEGSGEIYGSICEWRDPQTGDPGHDGPYHGCETEKLPAHFCQTEFEADDCYEYVPETFPECDDGNGGSNVAAAELPISPSGFVLVGASPIRVLSTNGVMRLPCGGWAVAISVRRDGPTRIVL